MKSIIILLSLLLCSLSYSQNDTAQHDCKKFHKGTFQMISKKQKIMIFRDATTQTETNLKTGEEYKYKISWINDCKYQLEPFKENEGDEDFFNGQVFMGEIISSSENTFKTKAGFVGDKTTVTDEFRKIE